MISFTTPEQINAYNKSIGRPKTATFPSQRGYQGPRLEDLIPPTTYSHIIEDNYTPNDLIERYYLNSFKKDVAAKNEKEMIKAGLKPDEIERKLRKKRDIIRHIRRHAGSSISSSTLDDDSDNDSTRPRYDLISIDEASSNWGVPDIDFDDGGDIGGEGTEHKNVSTDVKHLSHHVGSSARRRPRIRVDTSKALRDPDTDSIGVAKDYESSAVTPSLAPRPGNVQKKTANP